MSLQWGTPARAVSVARQTSRGMDDFHPRRIAVAMSAVRFLIGEAGESAQMTPVRTRAVSTIQTCQVPTYGGSEGRFQWGGTDMNPSLPMAGAGFEHHTRFMAVRAHRRQHRGISLIQIDQDVAGVPVLGIRMEVHVASPGLRTRKKRIVARFANCVAVHSRSPGNGRLVRLWIKRTR
jgi:hypothetical protein